MLETTRVTAEATNDTTQLLQQLLKKLDDMSNRERAMNARKVLCTWLCS
jgi:mannitol/fructose-specific phosphotransferase system IIA component (Ntr-type)